MEKFLFGATLFALSASASWAQDIYGYVGISGQRNHVDNIVGGPAVGDPDEEPFDFGQFGIAGSVGMNFSNDFYGQIDMRYLDTNVVADADDTLHDGYMTALRFGKNFDNARVGGFVGYVGVTGDDSVGSNEMQRVVYGIDVEYSMNSKFALFGELGGIGGAMGTQGTDGDDGIHDAVYIIAGLSYDIAPSLSLEGQLGYANGTHDNDEIDIMTGGLGLRYQTQITGLSTYLRADYTDYYQHGEDEGLASTTIQVGLVYEFGGGNSANGLRSLAPYEDWLGYSGGHLE